jgi:hypothetical protein
VQALDTLRRASVRKIASKPRGPRRAAKPKPGLRRMAWLDLAAEKTFATMWCTKRHPYCISSSRRRKTNRPVQLAARRLSFLPSIGKRGPDNLLCRNDAPFDVTGQGPAHVGTIFSQL